MTAHPTRVRIGIIGLGEVAQIIHLPILRALPDRFRVIAICDVSPALLASIDAIRKTAASS